MRHGFGQSSHLGPKMSKTCDVGGLRRDYEDLYSPNDFDHSNSSGALCGVGLHSYLVSSRVIIEFGLFGSLNVQKAK